jgi:hypothetical protein
MLLIGIADEVRSVGAGLASFPDILFGDRRLRCDVLRAISEIRQQRLNEPVLNVALVAKDVQITVFILVCLHSDGLRLTVVGRRFLRIGLESIARSARLGLSQYGLLHFGHTLGS